MSVTERKERQRADRYELILDTARALAEAEGWEAVTTRRVAELIEYSQPVLYSHFKGKADIMGAVAVRGFEELATRLKTAMADAPDAAHALRGVCAAYLDFARSHPVIYEAMFVLPTQLKFASETTPPALRNAFAQFLAALGPDRQTPEFVAEVLWSALHGMAVLERSGRIPAEGHEARLSLLIAAFESREGTVREERAAAPRRRRNVIRRSGGR